MSELIKSVHVDGFTKANAQTATVQLIESFHAHLYFVASDAVEASLAPDPYSATPRFSDKSRRLFEDGADPNVLLCIYSRCQPERATVQSDLYEPAPSTHESEQEVFYPYAYRTHLIDAVYAKDREAISILHKYGARLELIGSRWYATRMTRGSDKLRNSLLPAVMSSDQPFLPSSLVPWIAAMSCHRTGCTTAWTMLLTWPPV
jgi:hypothetical protein